MKHIQIPVKPMVIIKEEKELDIEIEDRSNAKVDEKACQHG